MNSPHLDPLFRLCRYAFYLSVLLFVYGTLFPFNFDFSPSALSAALDKVWLVPFWDSDRGRIHSLTDMASNVLLTIPLGFFGYLWRLEKGKEPGIIRWFVVGFLLSSFLEIIQLGVPSRRTGITDAINNGLGAFLGAVAAGVSGPHVLGLLSGSFFDKKRTSYLIILAVVIAIMLVPFDIGLDVSHAISSIRNLWLNPWESGVPLGDEWIHMVGFAILGGLAGSITWRRITAFTFILPIVLEISQVLVDSHSPSLRDAIMNFAGVAVGFLAARHKPSLIRPMTGFILMNLAILAQGLSPYQFVGWSERAHFERIPLIEYYHQSTAAALNDAMSGLLIYGLLAALWPRRLTILWAVALAGGIEIAQLIIPARFSGITDVIIAAIGAYTGYVLSKASAHR